MLVKELTKHVEAHAACPFTWYGMFLVVKWVEWSLGSTHDVRATGSIQFWHRNHGAATVNIIIVSALGHIGWQWVLRTGLWQWFSLYWGGVGMSYRLRAQGVPAGRKKASAVRIMRCEKWHVAEMTVRGIFGFLTWSWSWTSHSRYVSSLNTAWILVLTTYST